MINIGLIAYGEMGPFAFESLNKLFNINWIVTPIDTNRNLPVELLAKKSKVKILRTNSEKDIIAAINKTKPQIVVICSYNKIISPQALALTKFINVHHGDLPRFRGRANINWAIINGRKEIGISIHEVIPNLDAGNIYAQYLISINNKDTIKTIYDQVNKIIEKDLAKVTLKVLNGFKGKPQRGKPTYCCTRLPEDGLIDWNLTSKQIDRFIRALTKPYPGAFTFYQNQKMIIWDAEIPQKPRIYEGRIPGRIILIHKGFGVELLTGDSSIIIKTVEFQGQEHNASDLIKSVKQSLGINLVAFYEQFLNLNSK